MKNTVKTRLEDLLKSSNLTPYELAKKSGVEYTTIQRILNEDTKNPSKNTLAPIARVFNVSVEFLHSGAVIETELTLLQRALLKLEEQIDRKDALIERLTNKLLDPNFQRGLNLTGTKKSVVRAAA